MKDLYIAFFCKSIYVWTTIAIPYLLYRGLSQEQVFGILSTYVLAKLVFEFPTGMLGDYLGHKKSLMIGEGLVAISFVLIGMQGDYNYYLFCIAFLAFSQTFISGSDIALLSFVSKNFQIEYVHTRNIQDLGMVVSAYFGGLIAEKFGFEYAIIIPVISSLLGLYLFSRVHIDKVYAKDKKIASSKFSMDFFKTFFANTDLMIITVYSALILSFMAIIKYIFGGFDIVFRLSLSQIGFLIGTGVLFRAISRFAALKLQINQFKLGMVYGLMIFLGGTFFSLNITGLTLILANGLAGTIGIKQTAAMKVLADEEYRASTFSFRSVLSEIMESLYIWLINLFILGNSLNMLLIISGLALLGMSVLLMGRKNLQRI